jgi:hypothetical protein
MFGINVFVLFILTCYVLTLFTQTIMKHPILSWAMQNNLIIFKSLPFFSLGGDRETSIVKMKVTLY